MSSHKHGISIWYFIGLQLSIYGLMITGAGIYSAVNGEPPELKMSNFHAGIWWGAIMLAVGLLYVVKFRPSVRTGEEPHADENGS